MPSCYPPVLFRLGKNQTAIMITGYLPFSGHDYRDMELFAILSLAKAPEWLVTRNVQGMV